jgi:hypothetical protein
MDVHFILVAHCCSICYCFSMNIHGACCTSTCTCYFASSTVAVTGAYWFCFFSDICPTMGICIIIHSFSLFLLACCSTTFMALVLALLLLFSTLLRLQYSHYSHTLFNGQFDHSFLASSLVELVCLSRTVHFFTLTRLQYSYCSFTRSCITVVLVSLQIQCDGHFDHLFIGRFVQSHRCSLLVLLLFLVFVICFVYSCSTYQRLSGLFLSRAGCAPAIGERSSIFVS